MIKGLDSLLFKPDKILRELAQKAVSLKIDGLLLENNLEALRSLTSKPEVSDWLKSFDESKYPWFYFSNGNGFYSQDYSWIDDLEVPFSKIQTYVGLLKQGDDLAIDIEAKKAEKDEIIQIYKKLLPDIKLQREFEAVLKRAQMVAVYLEDHNFYIENWLNTIFWNKMRDVGLLLQNHGFLEAQNDIFYLDRWQVGQALYECVATWASGGKARGLFYWKEIIKDRKKTFNVLSKTPPTPACGSIPEKIQEPITLTLFGVNREMLEKWFSPESNIKDNCTLQGLGAVAGKITGEALVIKGPKDFSKIKPGNIVVCESLAPSWLSYFKQAKGIITNIGGIMSHSAIICREYNIPCILAVPSATEIINDGEMLTIDGKEGKVYRAHD